jgi:hypothetical protein
LISGPKPPVIFVVVSAGALAISALLVFVAGEFSFDWKIFIKSENLSLVILGYILSPFVPILSLAFLRNKDNQFRSNIFYDIGKGILLVRVASALAALSFLVGLLHIVRIAFVLQGA